jgi:hypothetical protein
VQMMYGRAFRLLRGVPLLFLIAVMVELVQHWIEWRHGMYTGSLDPDGKAARGIAGVLKILVLISCVIAAWRFWYQLGDRQKAFRVTKGLLKGMLVFVGVQIMGDAVAVILGRALATVGSFQEPYRNAVMLTPFLCWLLGSTLLFPWYVSLAVEDQRITFRKSLDAKRLIPNLAILIAGTMPLMTLRYWLAYTAIGSNWAWLVLGLDAITVGLLTVMVASTYYSLYERAIAEPNCRTDENPVGRPRHL